MKNQLNLLFVICILLFLGNTNFSQAYNFTNYSTINGLVNNKTTALIQDSRGYLWIGTTNGLSRFDGNSFVNYDQFHGLSENEISDIKIDVEGNLFVFHPNGKTTKISTDLTFEVQDSVGIIDDLKNNIPLKCKIENKRLIKIINQKEQIIYQISSKNGLVNEDINSALVDRENILWVATKTNGIVSLPLQNFPVYTWKYGSLVSCYKQNEGNYLLSFKNNIVQLKFEENNPIFSEVFSIQNKEINCAVIQFGDELFYGTKNGMFLNFNATKNEFSFEELSNKNVTQIEKIGDGDLIIIADQQIYLYLVYSNEMKLISGMEKFKANSIQKIDNTIYLLGDGEIYELKNKEFYPLLNQHPIAKTLNFKHLSLSDSNNLWITTEKKGLFLYDKQQDVLNNFNTEKNIPLTSIVSTIQEGNNLWISTKKEIIWYDIAKNTYSRFGEKHLKTTTFLPFTLTHNNSLYFATQEGLIQTFDSESFVSNANILDITNVLVQGKSFFSDSIIEIGYNNFPIQFDYLSISLKEKTYYQTKLEGYEEEWSKPTLKTSFSYSTLKPGNYTFRVRTIDPINELIINTDNKKFVVLPPFWKTPYFIYVLLGVLAVVVFLFYLFRLFALKKRAEKLEKLVNEKTFVLSAQNQNIEQFSYSLSHDLKNPINNIKGLVEIMEDSEDESQNEIKKLLMGSAELLENKIKATLKSIQQMQASKKNIELLHFNNLMADTKRSLLILIKENQVNFKTNFKVSSIKYSASILDSIFYNLISNSIKYGSDKRKTNITISSYKEGDQTVLEFEDNGIGIDMEKDLEKIFSIFERVDDDQATGSGLGLYMIKQMIELNGGSISLESELDKGTKFTIKLTPML